MYAAAVASMNSIRQFLIALIFLFSYILGRGLVKRLHVTRLDNLFDILRHPVSPENQTTHKAERRYFD